MNWQPIETAPKDGTWILLGCNLNNPRFIPKVEVCRWYDPADLEVWCLTGWVTHSVKPFHKATHWSHIEENVTNKAKIQPPVEYKNIPPKEIQNAIRGACFDYTDFDNDSNGQDVRDRVYRCWQTLHYILQRNPEHYAEWVRTHEPDIEV